MNHNIRSFIVGTAGHIDHGKTELVKQITDANPDRLPEEQERDLTIDLGFAEYVTEDGSEVGIIDVPGHERFIRNMVAGATAMDFVLLVVAADDGVMPQTREHLLIMDILGIDRGIAVITKIDLVDDVLVEVVEEELQELLEDTFMKNAPISRVSSETGEGFEEFLPVFEEYIQDTPSRSADGPFRMPVQRVFTVKGFGTVVTGVPLSGRVEKGDPVELQPGGKTGRIRGIQAHHREIETARSGHRTALNIAELHHENVDRGDVICTPDLITPRSILGADFKYVLEDRDPIEHWDPIRLHVGSAEVTGRIIPLESPSISPGEQTLVQFDLDESIPAVPGDPFVLRLQSPMITLGGGTILDLTRERATRSDTAYVQELQIRRDRLGDWREMARYHATSFGTDPFQPDDLARACFVREEDVRDWIDSTDLDDLGWIQLSSSEELYLSAEGFEKAHEILLHQLTEFHQNHPYLLGLRKHDLQGRSGLSPDVVQAVIDDLTQNDQIEMTHDRVRLASHDVSLPEDLEHLRDRIAEELKEDPFNTPPPDELRNRVSPPDPGVFESILQRMIQSGTVVEPEPEVYFHCDAVEEARESVISYIKEHGSLETGTFRDQLETSRKYAIPLLEYFDDTGLTYRKDNKRYLQ